MREPRDIPYKDATLADAIERHGLWIFGREGGERLSLPLFFDLRRADLSGADLRCAVLSGAVLRRAVLSGTDLSGTDLSGTVLSGTDLSDANLSDADLSDAVLSDADLSDAVLSDAVLRRAVLRRAVLRRADLSGTDLSDADLSDADLSDAVLSDADLSVAVLRRAVLRGAVLRRAVLSGTVLSGTDLSDADLSDCALQDKTKQRRRALKTTLQTNGGLILFRTKQSLHVGSTVYEPGNTYVAPVLSECPVTDCHPGIYGLPYDQYRMQYGDNEGVMIYVPFGEWHFVSREKGFRSRRVRVLADVPPMRKDEDEIPF